MNENYIVGLEGLFNNRYTTEKEVRDALESIYEDIQENHQERCASKALFNTEKREVMISKFCDQYLKGMEPWQMCHTKIMRKFSKHNGKVLHTEFINSLMIDFQMSYFFPRTLKNEITVDPKNDPRIRGWFLNYNCIIQDDMDLENHNNIYKLPNEYSNKILFTEIFNELNIAREKKFLSENSIRNIIEALLDNPEFCTIEEQNLSLIKDALDSEDPSLDASHLNFEEYFIYKFMDLIKSGMEHQDVFKIHVKSLLEKYLIK